MRRLEGALDYLNQYPDSVAIVSGGMGKGEDITEAKAMHDWLVQHGLPEERVLMEPKATSTEENLRYSGAPAGRGSRRCGRPLGLQDGHAELLHP